MRFSLCLLMRREDSGLLLEKLCELLDPQSSARLDGMSWSPETETIRKTRIGTFDVDARGIAGMTCAEFEGANDYCLSLLVQLEPDLKEVLSPNAPDCFGRRGSFGCMWTTVQAGRDYLLLQMSAATGSMSRVLERSRTIHDAWIALAKKTNALLAYLDVEERTAVQLFPSVTEVYLPDWDTLTFENDVSVSVDRWAEFLRGETGL